MSGFSAILFLRNRKKFARFTPARIIVLGFIILIFIGTLLLQLPISTKSGSGIHFTDALFTATSSVCVTGLVVVDTNTYWSLFGKVVILILIQIGALGIMSVFTIHSMFTGRNMGLTQRMAVKESISNYSLENIVAMFKKMIVVTLVIEGVGALITSFELIPVYGIFVGIGKSIFHSVSSFCNAGFDVFGSEADQFVSLSGFINNDIFLLTTSALVIIGGLGFIVWEDVAGNRKFSRLSLHTRIVLLMTVILIGVGTLTYFAFESGQTMEGKPLSAKLVNAFFQSVSVRTAGFNTFSYDEMNPITCMITIILMFIGAAPGSTAGGIKVTTFFVLIVTIISFMKGHNEVQVFKRRIAADTINKAISVFMLSLTLIMITTIVLLANHEGSLMQTLFEAVSALGTVGVSTGITSGLNDISKYQLIITMLLGRVGIITVIASISGKGGKENITYRYAEGKITVG